MSNGDRLGRLVGTNLAGCIENMATNHVCYDEVFYILSPHRCTTEKHHRELVAHYTDILAESVTEHFKQSGNDQPHKTACHSIAYVFNDLLHGHKIIQPAQILTPDAPAIAPVDHMVTFGDAYYWIDKQNGEKLSFGEHAKTAPQKVSQSTRRCLLDIEQITEEYDEARSFGQCVLNALGVFSPKQKTLQRKMAENITILTQAAAPPSRQPTRPISF